MCVRHQTYNSKPYEITKTRDGAGNKYHSIFNRTCCTCVESLDVALTLRYHDAACGTVIEQLAKMASTKKPRAVGTWMA
jgi:hypothetical protein